MLKNHGWITLNRIGARVARALVFGRFEDAHSMAARVAVGLHDGLVAVERVTRLGPFVLRLWADWKTAEDPLGGLTGLLFEPAYEEMLEKWRNPAPADLQGAVDGMCAIHRARSGQSDKKEWYEFSWDYEYLWPVEILAVFRLREQLGLANPEIREPFFPEPLRRLPPLEPWVTDPLLAQVREKLEREFGQTLPIAKA